MRGVTTTGGASELELKGAAFFGTLACVEKLHGVKVVEVTHGFARVSFEDFHGLDKWMWLDAIAGFEVVFEMVGAKNPRAIIEAGGDGPSMTLALRWES
jgi:hypothetical protein